MKLPKANSIPDEISFPAGGKIVPDVYQAEVESESGYRSLKPYLDDWSRKDLGSEGFHLSGFVSAF